MKKKKSGKESQGCMRKLNKTTVGRKLDKICSLIVRMDGKCRVCGGVHCLQCAHIYTRKFRATRWDFLNLLCLCASCHRRAHDRPTEFSEWVFKEYGKEKYSELKIKANSVKKWTAEEMDGLYKTYQVKYEVLNEKTIR